MMQSAVRTGRRSHFDEPNQPGFTPTELPSTWRVVFESFAARAAPVQHGNKNVATDNNGARRSFTCTLSKFPSKKRNRQAKYKQNPHTKEWTKASHPVPPKNCKTSNDFILHTPKDGPGASHISTLFAPGQTCTKYAAPSPCPTAALSSSAPSCPIDTISLIFHLPSDIVQNLEIN